jgi:ribonuclease HI
MNEYFAYTDGACSGNPGPGGWGVLLIAKKQERVIKELELFGGEADTTNNRMELTAAIKALISLKKNTKITIVTDSKYVKIGITEWLVNWKRNNWRTSSNKPVKNADLWAELDKLCEKNTVVWQWVKGHAGHIENEKVDELARTGLAPFKKI